MNAKKLKYININLYRVLPALRVTHSSHLFRLSNVSMKTARIGSRIGNKSAYGQVFSIDIVGFPKGAFVLKLMPFKAASDQKIFMNEVNVGVNQELYLQKVGPVIVAYKLTKYYGAYLMNSFTEGKQGLQSMSLSSYVKKENYCPRSNSPLVRKLRESLLKFYNITKGFHGDLHSKNIALTLDTNNKIQDVYIFDYGAHTFFKEPNAISRCKTILEAFDLVNANFNQRWNDAHTQNYYPLNSDVRLIRNTNKQPYRSNVNMLRYNAQNIFNKMKSPQNVLTRWNSTSGSSSSYHTAHEYFSNI